MTTTPVIEWYQVGDVTFCHNCGNVDYMFTNNFMTESQKASCAYCCIVVTRSTVCHLFPGMAQSEATEHLTNSLKAQYDYRTLGVSEWCEVCLKPYLESHDEYSKVTAVDADGKPITCHRRCCSVNHCRHDECRNTLVIDAFPHNVRWGTFDWQGVQRVEWRAYSFHFANGSRMCHSHLEEWMESQDGDWFHCDGCGDYYSNSYDYFTHYDSIYCENCRDNNFYSCNRCDETVHQDDDHDCSEYEDSVVHSYSYKPYPCFFGTTKGSAHYHLGFELEVESRNEDNCYDEAKNVQDSLGTRAYMKEDGSLRGGFEIVTHPHTLEEYKDNFPWEFIRVAKRNNLVSWNSPRCGFHVHVSRYAFGPGMKPSESPENYYQRTIIVRQQHELKFLKLIYDNERQVQRLAGRKSDWARFTDKGNLWRKVKHGYQSEGHYSAVNVENSNTIEVRVFRGSLKQERLMANLEFVHSAVEYTRNLRVSATNKALSWIAYSGYVYQNADKYPHLLEYMDTIAKQEQVYDNRTEDGE